jgi:hypothetical protein
MEIWGAYPGQKRTFPGQKHTFPGHVLSQETDNFSKMLGNSFELLFSILIFIKNKN